MKRIVSIIMAALSGAITAFAEQVTVADVALRPGNSTVVEIALDNEHADLVAFQMDLTLPEGIGIDKTGCSLSSRFTDQEQQLIIGKLSEGVYRLTSTSFTLTPISGNSGTLLALKLTSTANFVRGQANISNVIFSTSSSQKVALDNASFGINTIYTLTYMIGEEVYKVVAYNYGATITPEAQPEGDYASFEWIGVPETMPAHDVTVHASYVTGITDIALAEKIVRIYSPNGKVLNKPQKGLNLVLMRDGTIRKSVFL